MPAPKLFASDFDGTLNFHDGTPVRDADRAAIASFQRAGNLFGICTGRSLHALLIETSDLVTLDFVIADSGACVYGRDGGAVFARTLPRAVARGIWETYHARSTWGGVISAAGDYFAIGGEPQAWVHTVGSFDDIPPSVHGVSFGTDTNDEARAMADEVNRTYAHAAVAYQNLNSIDVVPVGCSKGTGVTCVRELLGAGLVAGMGDSFNDLALLAAADVAYTFPHATSQLRDCANLLVDSVAEALADFTARP